MKKKLGTKIYRHDKKNHTFFVIPVLFGMLNFVLKFLIIFQVACSVGYVIKRRVEILSLGSHLTGECIKRWTAMLRRALAALATRASSLAVLAARLADTAKALDAVAQATDRVNQKLPEDGNSDSSNRWSQETQVLSDEMSAGWKAAIGQLHTRYVAGDALQTEWIQATADIKCPYQHRLPQRAKILIDK